MKEILVPTDFSKCAENAIDFAVQSAKIIPMHITLLHSFELNDNMYTDYIGVNREFNQTMLIGTKEKLANLKESINENNGVAVDTVISKDSLQESITRSLQENKIELIVMGTLGASGIKEKLWGSRTASTIGKSGIPVIAIPNDYKWKKPQKILFATNQFEKDSAILNIVFELAGLYLASVQVSIFTDEDDDKARTFLENKRKISEYESFLKETYNEDTLTSVHLYGENFNETMQDFINKNDIDMLVMVTYPQKFWNRIFNQSKTKLMSYHTRIPLLAIPASVNAKK